MATTMTIRIILVRPIPIRKTTLNSNVNGNTNIIKPINTLQ